MNLSRTRLGIETLEARDNPSISIVGNLVEVIGSNASETVSIRIVNGNIVVRENSTGLSLESSAPAAGITRIRYVGNGGNDSFINNTSINASIDGGAGNDSITSGNGNDTVFGGTGNDTLRGCAGNDLLYGQAGNDSIFGGSGNDVLDGGTRTETNYGNGGTGADIFREIWFTGIADYNPTSQGDRRTGYN